MSIGLFRWNPESFWLKHITSVLCMSTVEAPRSRELPRDAVSFKTCLPQARACAAQPLGSYRDPVLYFPNWNNLKHGIMWSFWRVTTSQWKVIYHLRKSTLYDRYAYSKRRLSSSKPGNLKGKPVRLTLPMDHRPLALETCPSDAVWLSGEGWGLLPFLFLTIACIWNLHLQYNSFKARQKGKLKAFEHIFRYLQKPLCRQKLRINLWGGNDDAWRRIF